jgi:hypothetical protein
MQLEAAGRVWQHRKDCGIVGEEGVHEGVGGHCHE